MKIFKRLTTLIGLLFLAWIVLSYVGAVLAAYPNPVELPEASRFFDGAVTETTLKTSDGVEVAIWYIAGDTTKSVVLANGIRGNRRGVVSRAKLYQQRGFGVVLIDLRGTGESQQAAISYGWHERLDIIAAVDFLEEKGYLNVGVHGISLGAAAISYSLQERDDYAFMVLESCYESMQNALANRMKMRGIPLFTTILMQRFSEWRIGVKTDKLRPVDYVPYGKMPTLILAGEKEKRVKRSETENIFAASGGMPKSLHYIKDAAHVNLHQFAPAEYEKYWAAFVEGLTF